MQANEYDLVVIGSGPAGQKGAICAAKMRKKVAIIDRRLTMGGVCVHTGTIPSKVLREAVLYLSGLRQRSFYGRGYVVKDRIMMSDLVLRSTAVMTREVDVIKAQLRRNYVTALEGDAHFADPHTIEIVNEEGVQQVRGEKILDCLRHAAVAHRWDSGGREAHLRFGSGALPGRDTARADCGGRGDYWAGICVDVRGARSEGDAARPASDAAGFCGSGDHRKPVLPVAATGNGFPASARKWCRWASTKSGTRFLRLLESGKKVRGQALLYTIGRQANSDKLKIEAAGLAGG